MLVLYFKPFPRQHITLNINQGGCLVFEGPRVILSHADPSTGKHIDLDVVFRTVKDAEERACNTDACELPQPQQPPSSSREYLPPPPPRA
jgi:hypothetical protein